MKIKKSWYGTVTLALLAVAIVLVSVFYYFEETNSPKPFGQIPTQHQLEWNGLEYYMFVHFGPNTFTNVEWGNGKEDPKVFNPTNVDCRQWASIAKDAGMKGIIITAKHHDGFCLWPSNYSTHTVRESLWKDGKGDLLKELSEACKEYGLKFGVYLSPWDQNHPSYGTPEYNDIFAKTLAEVLTNYGEVYEQWFDGANGGNNKQPYDWNLFHNVVYKHQPQAVIFSDVGPGCRWIGNERGIAGETNWSRIDTTGFGPGLAAPHRDILNQGLPSGEAWIPGEVDVSIRPGWFYSPTTDDKVKTIDQLMDIYYTSVGRNANLLLNVPPSRTGRIHANDSTRLMEFRATLDEEFKENLIKGASLTATNTRGVFGIYSASNLINGDKNSYWATDEDIKTASVEIDFGKETTLNRVLLQEYIALGQRISEFNIEAWDKNTQSWCKLIDATTIGYKRILRFPEVTTSKLRINITNALSAPILLHNIEVYKAPGHLAIPRISRDKEGMVKVTSASKDAVIYYTTDGSVPSISSTRYTIPFSLLDGGDVKAITAIDGGQQLSSVEGKIYDVASIGWKQQQPTREYCPAIDGDESTCDVIDGLEALVVYLNKGYMIKGFTYIPDKSNKVTNVQHYNLYLSGDGQNWEKVLSNKSFDNIKNSPVEQRVLFEKPINAKFIKFEPIQLTDLNEKRYAVAEIGIITR